MRFRSRFTVVEPDEWAGNMRNVGSSLSDFSRSQNYPRCFLLISFAMSSVCGIATSLRNVAVRRSILSENLAEHASQLNTSARSFCTAAFVKEYFEDADRVSLLFLPEVLQNSADWVESLTKELYAEKSSVYVLDTRDIGECVTKSDISSNVVILSESVIALEESDLSFANCCEHDRDLVVLLTRPFDDEDSFLNDTDTLTREMWSRSILKLAILASVGDAVLSADSIAVRIDRSYASVKPRLLGRCERIASAIGWRVQNETELSARIAATVNAAVLDNFPYAFIRNDNTTNQPIFGGIEGMMVEEIAHNMKAKLNRQLVEWTDNSTMAGELSSRLCNATDDLVFGGFRWNSSLKTRYTVSYGMLRVAWMVPVTPNVSFNGLISSFLPYVWYAIIGTIIIGGLVKLFARDISFLDIVGLIFGTTVHRQPTKTFSRIQFVSWALFGFFLTQFYLGSLAKQLIYTSDEQIESMKELVNSGLMLGGPEQFEDLFSQVSEDGDERYDEHDEIIQAIHKRYIAFERPDYFRQFLDLVEGRNSSLALLVMLNLTDLHFASSHRKVHVVQQMVGRYPLALSTWQGFPYLKEFNFKIRVVVQAGLIKFWSNMVALYAGNYYEKIDDDDDPSMLHLSDIASVFLLLLIGCLGAFCMLIAEVIFYPSRILM